MRNEVREAIKRLRGTLKELGNVTAVGKGSEVLVQAFELELFCRKTLQLLKMQPCASVVASSHDT